MIDFGEAPSQMLENWCWTPSVLKSLSCHYSTLSPEYKKLWEDKQEDEEGKRGVVPLEKIPDSMIESLVKAKYTTNALFNLLTLVFAVFDMAVHEPSSSAAISSMNIGATYNQLRKEILLLDGPEAFGFEDDWGHGYAKIPHFMGSYDAGFYSYAL